MSENAIHLAQSAVASVIELQARVAGLETRLASLSGQIHALGSTVTPQGQTVTGLTNSIKSEVSARSAADTALGARIENYRSDHKGADAVATSALTARITGSSQISSPITANGEPILQVDPGKAVEPLRLGKVTFYGESARVIRNAQAVLESAGAGQLEVVKREPFKITADGQVFISEALVGKAAIQKAQVVQHSVMPTEQPKPRDATEILDEISSQINESELGNDLTSRIVELEQGREKQGGENRSINDRLTALSLGLVTARSRADQRIDALQAQVDNLQSKVYSRD